MCAVTCCTHTYTHTRARARAQHIHVHTCTPTLDTLDTEPASYFSFTARYRYGSSAFPSYIFTNYLLVKAVLGYRTIRSAAPCNGGGGWKEKLANYNRFIASR